MSTTCSNNFSIDTGSVRCVIFDKDGTIVCFHSMWTPWAKSVAAQISQRLGLELELPVLKRLGVDARTGRTGPGLLAEATKKEIADSLTELAVEAGAEPELAKTVVAEVTLGCDIEADRLRFVEGVEEVFQRLRAAQIRIAVCTSDDRSDTERALLRGGLSPFVDAVACGNDPDILPKPHRSNADSICRQLQLLPQDCIMVGDTVADVGLGATAGLKASVGVLTGIADEQLLLKAGADCVVESVRDLPLLLGF